MITEIFWGGIGVYILYKIVKYIKDNKVKKKVITVPKIFHTPHTKVYHSVREEPIVYKRQYRKTYIDKNGYKRHKDNGKLIHREIAWSYIYNYKTYPLRFGEYQVHHIDGNKLNNKKTNLQLLTRVEHKKIHKLK